MTHSTAVTSAALRLNEKLLKDQSRHRELDEKVMNMKVENSNEADVRFKEKSSLVMEMIQKLPEKYRHVIELDLKGDKDMQIAESLQISPGTVKSRNSRGRDILRRMLHRDLVSTDII